VSLVSTAGSTIRALRPARHCASRGWIAAIAALVSWAIVPFPVAAQPAGYVGEKTCLRCHDSEEKHFAYTLHAKVFRQNPRTELEKRGCESCHGPGEAHVKNPADHATILGFTREWGTPVDKQNGQCIACHQGGQRMHWPGSVHARNELACSDCHNPMERQSAAGLLRKASISATCETCHQQQRAEFRRRSHMPVPEGKMSCADCHNPHGSTRAPMLKADSVNDLCYACHAEKRGPFLWEHAPARESCLNCHHPHGSNHDKLLTVARPQLCQQCHDPSVGHPPQLFRADQMASAVAQGGTASSRVIGRSCQNCHSQIHGSNHPAGTRFQR
jgi:DmsE family decaheme c-type cytochrome